jgi:7-keto-8-aminopelargonate synthetase-like enzyme
MATTVAKLQAVLEAKTSDFDKAMDKSQSKMGTVGKAAGIAGAAIAGGLSVTR